MLEETDATKSKERFGSSAENEKAEKRIRGTGCTRLSLATFFPCTTTPLIISSGNFGITLRYSGVRREAVRRPCDERSAKVHTSGDDGGVMEDVVKVTTGGKKGKEGRKEASLKDMVYGDGRNREIVYRIAGCTNA